MFTKLLLISVIGLLVHDCRSEPNKEQEPGNSRINDIHYLHFLSGKSTVGDRDGKNQVDQLNCVGDANLCHNYSPDKVTCTNICMNIFKFL